MRSTNKFYKTNSMKINLLILSCGLFKRQKKGSMIFFDRSERISKMNQTGFAFTLFYSQLRNILMENIRKDAKVEGCCSLIHKPIRY